MKSKGTQFGNYTLERSTGEGLTADWDEYRLLHHDPTGVNHPVVAGAMTVRMGHGGPGQIHYPSGQEGIAMTPKADRASHTGYTQGWALYTKGRAARDAARGAQSSGGDVGAAHDDAMLAPHQIPMFTMEGAKAPSSKVDSMFMAKQHRHMATTMLGVAQNRSRLLGHGDLRSPTDLSPYSSQLVAGLKDRGVLGAHVSSEQRNTHTWVKADPTHPQPENDVPLREVRQGQSTMRAVTRRPRQRKPPEQGKLF